MSKAAVVEKFEADPHSKMSLRLWLRLLGCSMSLEKRVRQNLLDEFGMTLPQFDVLAALERVPEGLTMSDLSQYLLVSNGNVTGIVARLIKEKMIVRQQDPDDRRSFTVKLTPSGATAFKSMARRHETWIDNMLSDLSAADMKTLMNGLERMKESINKSKS